MIKLLKNMTKFIKDDTCQEMFDQLKQLLTSHPILCKLDTNQSFLVYIAAIVDAISATLVQEINNDHKLIYFISWML